MQNDLSKIFVFCTVFLNNRLKMYENYIRYALSHGYYCCGINEYYQKRNQKDNCFVLRHDIDFVSPATRKMFDIEKKLGVTSTYYFRNCTFEPELVRDIHEAGFEVGFHYETITDIARERNYTSKEQVDISEARERFLFDLKKFETKAGFKTHSCCSHGDALARLIGMSNNALFEGIEAESLTVEVEAYSGELYEKYITTHIMDSNIRTNYGFAYKSNPIQAINNYDHVIVFLSHPHNWLLAPKVQLGNLILLFCGRVTYSTNRQFIRVLK